MVYSVQDTISFSLPLFSCPFPVLDWLNSHLLRSGSSFFLKMEALARNQTNSDHPHAIFSLLFVEVDKSHRDVMS